MSDIALDYNARALTVGMTESGKSELINVRFSAIRCQRALYDSKDEFAIDGVTPARTPDELDWRAPTLHFIPGEDPRGDAQAFFAQAFRRRHLYVAVHELGELCDYNANGAPPALSRYIAQGARHGLGLDAGTQRPVGNPKRALTEALHFYVFTPRLNAADLDTIARELGTGPEQLGAVLDETHDELGDYSYVHWSRRTRTLTRCPPLPGQLRDRSIVQRTSVT